MRRSVFLLFLFCLFMPDGVVFADECPARPVVVKGSSLLPLLQDGVSVMMRPVSCAGEIGRGDLVVFRSGAHELPIIKIAHGVPKDVFAIDEDGHIVINGVILENSVGEAYALPESQRGMLLLYHREFKGVIPADVYLLLGDGAWGVLDSTRLGFLHRNNFVMVGSYP